MVELEPEEQGVDIQALFSMSDAGKDIDIQALAARSFRKGMEYGNKDKSSPNTALMLPQLTFNGLSRDRKSMWIKMTDNDRAVIVLAIGSAVASKPTHPSTHPRVI